MIPDDTPVLTRRDLIALACASALSTTVRASEHSHSPRTVSLDWALTETMLALDHPPIAIIAASDWSRFVVHPELPAQVRDLGLQQEVNLELLARLQPDLILTSPFIEYLDQVLPRIAPTQKLSIFEPDNTPLAHPRKLTRQVGELLGLSDRADAYLLHADHKLDDCRARLASLSLPPIIVGSFIDGRHLRVYGGSGLFQNVLDQIGLLNAWQKPTSYWGFATIGVEQLADTTAGHFISPGPLPAGVNHQLTLSPLWTTLWFVEQNNVSVLAPSFMFGALPAAVRFATLLTDSLEAHYS